MKSENKLHYETVTPRLQQILTDLMNEPVFAPFALAGGTSLSLRYGHRISVDIDMFTNAEYGSLDFALLEQFLKDTYSYYDCTDRTDVVGFGRGYYVGESEDDFVKVDLYYHDDIIEPYETIDNIRLVSAEDVAAMKIDVISRTGRKKDFWDIHELLNHYTIDEMIAFHEKRREWDHDRQVIINNLTDFSIADQMPDPVCLREKDWGVIKMSFYELAKQLK